MTEAIRGCMNALSAFCADDDHVVDDEKMEQACTNILGNSVNLSFRDAAIAIIHEAMSVGKDVLCPKIWATQVQQEGHAFEMVTFLVLAGIMVWSILEGPLPFGKGTAVVMLAL